MKNILQKTIKFLHQQFLDRGMPSHVHIYFHELDDDWVDAFRLMAELMHSHGRVCVFPEDRHNQLMSYSVSFDDNYVSWYTELSLMQELGMLATFYINTCVFADDGNCVDLQAYRRAIGYAGNLPPLSRSQVKEISDAGHRIGAHTHSHANVGKLSTAEFRRELQTNCRILEEITGKKIVDFAFPYGMPRNFSVQAQVVCEQLGIKTVAHATPGMLHAKLPDGVIHRTGWKRGISPSENLLNLAIDGKFFVGLTGRSPVG